MAKKEDQALLEDVIAQLDITRQQVYIEALFMEVSVNKNLDLGVEWHTGETVGSTEGTNIIGFGRQVQNQSFPENVLSSTGLSFGILGEDITLGNVTFPSIAAVVNAMETESDVTILQKPQIVATDNEEATLNVGKNVPFLTRGERQDISTGISYANYEWRDVGVILKITPQINLEREVTLKLSLEISQVVQEEGVETGLSTTLDRSLETTVTVKDAHTVAMGGLIEKTSTDGVTRTPCLGRIPLLGWLFKGVSKTDDKTNLYIFLTPHIIESSQEAEEIYREKRDDIDELSDGVIKMYEGRPNDTDDMILSDQGFELLEAEDYDKAEDYFERALEINPDNPYALLNLGVVYDVKGEREKAIGMYEKVIKLDPDDRATLSTDPEKIGNRLADIARDNLKRLR
jgi:general secretion pathway protein D